MKELRMVLLTIFVALLPSVTFGPYGTCRRTNGRMGECISTSSCKTLGGSSDPANLCPGDNSIQVEIFHIELYYSIVIFIIITVLHLSRL
jgi:hypothetical protein